MVKLEHIIYILPKIKFVNKLIKYKCVKVVKCKKILTYLKLDTNTYIKNPIDINVRK